MVLRLTMSLLSCLSFVSCLSLLFGGVSAAAPARVARDGDAGRFEPRRQTVERLEGELGARHFGGVLDVVGSGGRSLFRLASPPELSTRSVFWVGSVSKQFAAVAALRLVDRGKLSLDAPLGESLGPAGRGRGAVATCTLAQILHHTCGLPPGNVCSGPELLGEDARERLLRCVGNLELRSRPGTGFVYSNVGYDLIGALVSRTAGVPYGDFLRNEFFAPLGMRGTGVDLGANPDARRRLVQGEAFNGFGWSRTWPWLLLDPTGPGKSGASGNVFSTAGDLHAWNRALHGGRILSARSHGRLVTPALADYGLGVAVEESAGGTRWIWHNGSLTPMGWSSFLAYIPRMDVSIVGLANRGRHSSNVIPAARALALDIMRDEIGTPLLGARDEEGLALEMAFFILPLMLVSSVVWVAWTLVRGPAGRAVNWYGTLLTAGALYLFAVSLFDFYGRAAAMSPVLLAVVAGGILVHRKALVWPGRQDLVDRAGCRAIAGHLFAAGLLALVSEPVARLWLGAFALSQGALIFYLVSRQSAYPPVARAFGDAHVYADGAPGSAGRQEIASSGHGPGDPRGGDG